MKAITICQPFAWGVIHGPKVYENRSWPSSYRGLLLIHAGKSRKYLDDDPEFDGQPSDRDLTFGAIIGVVRMIDCLPVARARPTPCAEGPYCHEYADAYAFFEPVPCLGMLGHWDVPPQVESLVRDQLAAIRINP